MSLSAIDDKQEQEKLRIKKTQLQIRKLNEERRINYLNKGINVGKKAWRALEKM